MDKVKISIDHITVTSDDRRRIDFESTIRGYKYLGFKPTKGSYKIFHEYLHTETKNKVHILTDRREAYYLPNLTIKFFPTWENKLRYDKIIRVLNQITEKYNIPFNLSQYHVAIDLFTQCNHLDRLVKWTKSGRKYDPKEEYPGTYYFHSWISKFSLIAYDKKKQLKNKDLSEEAIQELTNYNVTRIEARYRDNYEIPSIEELATHCFKDLIPRRIQFLAPDNTKLRKHGIKPIHYKDIGLKGLSRLLEAKEVNNLFYYTKENTRLSNMVKTALKKYQWCTSPHDHPIVPIKLVIRPQGIKFNQQ